MLVVHPEGSYPNPTACPLSHHCLETHCPLSLMTLGLKERGKEQALKSSDSRDATECSLPGKLEQVTGLGQCSLTVWFETALWAVCLSVCRHY